MRSNAATPVDRVQDPYAVRCMPQVLGAAWDTLQHCGPIVEAECNAATDNPLVLDEEIVSGGNLRAAPMGYVLAIFWRSQ